MDEIKGKLYIVGIGPGSIEEMTVRAQEALKLSRIIVGYSVYVDLIKPFCADKVVVSSGMGKEKERCEAALREAVLGNTVAIVSSGDSGLYGMAGLILEIALHKGIEDKTTIEIVPGVPAFVAAGAVVGAPLMNDFASISLSDLLNPWEKIEKRLQSVAEADFVTCLYNPKSTKRVNEIEMARDIFLKYRDKETPCAIIRNVSREGEKTIITTLDELTGYELDMFCIVIIGNSETRHHDNWLITSRGYKL